MKRAKTMLVLLAMPVILFLGSCTKDNQVTPAGSQATSADKQAAVADDEALLPGEAVQGAVSPGTYIITKFTDTGDDKTAIFAGYTFKFKANLDLIATDPNGTAFKGSYSLNADGTIMTINIAGTPELKNLDDNNWGVKLLSNKRIKIKKNGPDIVVFQKM